MFANKGLSLRSARLLIEITAAQLRIRAASEDAVETERKSSWQAILSHANTVISVLQYWNPTYCEAADPMLSYIPLLAACVITLDSKLPSNVTTLRSSEHVDLVMLFLSRIGQYWPIGTSYNKCSLAPGLYTAINGFTNFVWIGLCLKGLFVCTALKLTD